MIAIRQNVSLAATIGNVQIVRHVYDDATVWTLHKSGDAFHAVMSLKEAKRIAEANAEFFNLKPCDCGFCVPLGHSGRMIRQGK
jgi:hypothetical protein